MRKLWENLGSQAVSLHARFLSGQWSRDRNKRTFHSTGSEEGWSNVGAASGGRVQASVSARQQALEVKRHALLDVGGIEGDTMAHRKKNTQRVDEIRELWNYGCQLQDGSYLYSKEFREEKAQVNDEAKARKDTPIFSGVLQYFPKALAEVARVSKIGNDQHNPGSPLHWDRSKSGDELDALTRHLVDAGTMDTDGTRHSAKVAWRALANLEKELENE